MKVIVFGGSGFLGSHVADALSEKGFEVFIFDKVLSPYLQAQQKMILGDMLDQEQVRQAVRGMDYVYHFTGIADIQEANEKPIDTAHVNIMSTMFILDACREFGIKRFLYASTVYVYSDQGGFYRSSKQACELFIENYQKIYGLNFTILRYGSLFGRRANRFNFIKNAIEQAIQEKKITRKGNGNEIRDYINVLDAARTSVIILEQQYQNTYVMLTGSQTIRMRDLLNMIREMLNNEVEIQYTDEHFDGHYEITPYAFRPRVAKKVVLDYYHDLGQGILDTIYDVYKSLHQ